MRMLTFVPATDEQSARRTARLAAEDLAVQLAAGADARVEAAALVAAVAVATAPPPSDLAWPTQDVVAVIDAALAQKRAQSPLDALAEIVSTLACASYNRDETEIKAAWVAFWSFPSFPAVWRPRSDG